MNDVSIWIVREIDLPDIRICIKKPLQPDKEKWLTIYEIRAICGLDDNAVPKIDDSWKITLKNETRGNRKLDIGRITKKFRPKLKLHWSLLLLPILAINRFMSGWEEGFFYLGLIILLYFIITLHELGHMLMAHRLGYATEKITLTPLGGLASIKMGLVMNARHELLIAVAGPAVNVVLFLFTLPFFFLFPEESFGAEVAALLLMINAILFIFNVVVFAYPMDGGRILRSILQLVFKYDFYKSTKICVRIATFLAIAMIVAGIVWAHFGLIFIGLFVMLMSNFELAMLNKMRS